MLIDTDLDVTQLDYVRTAQASGKALVALINEVLDQAKIESGKLELEEVQFDLRAVLDDVLSLLSGKSQDKGVEVRYLYRTDLPYPLSPSLLSLFLLPFIQCLSKSLTYLQFCIINWWVSAVGCLHL